MKYIEGEIFELKDNSKDNNLMLSDDAINEKYLKGEIRIITEQARYPLDTIPGILKSGKYNLNPEYQRRKRWNVQQKSRLIESFIINVPIPPIFIYEVEFAEYEVMDGLQRLTTIQDFYGDKFSLTGLEQWTELNGKKYSTLPKKIREGIDRRYLSSIVLLNETAKNKEDADFLKQIVFGRLNSGGDKLVAQESRNALYGGRFNSFCIELSKNEYFRKLWNFPLIEMDSNNNILNEDELLKSESYRKMQDVELVLRFFAYRHLDKLASLNSQERFLDVFLLKANSFPQSTLSELQLIFEKTVELIYKIFNTNAFYMPDGIQKKSTPTKTIYDALMQSMSKIIDKETIIISKKQSLIDNKYSDKSKLVIEGKTKNNQLFDGKYNGKTNVSSRIKYFDKYFESILS